MRAGPFDAILNPMSIHVLRREQTVAAPLRDVFAFFERPDNLARITPAWLDFRIVGPDDLTMRRGLEIEYRIRPLKVPQRWVSRITEYDPPHRFVDEQRVGPYRSWHHLHVFEALDEGRTRIVDEVTYELPLGPLGDLAHILFVRRQLRGIFAHRFRVIEERFGAP